MIINSHNSIAANNAAFNWMKSANAMTRLASSTSFKGANYVSLHNADKNLSLQMFNDSLMYKINMLIAESQEKIKKENIKRSFSILG